nr:hypothetical protein [Tanacetum cinerariifolium]
MNEANMKAVQTQINIVKNEVRNEMKNSMQASLSNEIKNMMASLFQMNTASTSGSGSLPSNTVANPKGELKSITTRSGIVLDAPTVPTPPLLINPEEDGRVEETLKDSDLSYEPKCKALADLGASINLMQLSVWKKLADFVILDYVSDLRVPLILGRPFLRTARALIDVHGKEIILRDGDERLTLNMRHDTLSYSNQPQKESINLIIVFNNSSEDFLEDLFSTNQSSGNPTFLSHPELTLPEVKDDIFDSDGGNVLPEKLLYLDSTKDLHPPLYVNPLSGSTTYSSSPLLEELTDELALITFPPKYDDDLYNLANPAENFVDSMLEMFIDEHALDYSSPPIFDEYDDDFLETKSNTKNVYDDPFDSNGEKIKESKLLIDELDIPCDLPPFEYDSFISQDFSRVDAKPSTNNEDKVHLKSSRAQKNQSLSIYAYWKQIKGKKEPKAENSQKEAKFMQTVRRTHFYDDYHDRDSNQDNCRSSKRNDYSRNNYRSNSDDKPYDIKKQLSHFMKSQFADKQSGRPTGSLSSNTQPNPKGSSSKPYQRPDDEDEEPTPQPKAKKPKPAKETLIPKPYKPKIPYSRRLRKEKMEAQYGKFLDMIRAVRINVPLIVVLAEIPTMENFSKNSIDVIDEILEEDFDVHLDGGSEIFHSIEGTILKEKLFVEFNEFIAMTSDENSESESDTEEITFTKSKHLLKNLLRILKLNLFLITWNIILGRNLFPSGDHIISAF